jgi:hypothetical protein
MDGGRNTEDSADIYQPVDCVAILRLWYNMYHYESSGNG